ncbi:MAG: alpha/beta hydrolase [Eubacteriales bacterium]|nr:alpha/beta hydrolase [Eubacteriales bacterium]
MGTPLWRRHPEWGPEELWEEGKTPGYCAQYGQDSSFLTPFLLPGQGNPAIVIFPGGGYEIKAEYEGLDIARRFNDLGFSAFVVDYRVKPYGFPAAQLDGQRAVRYVRAHAARFGIRRDQVAVLGFSAGGHLAACTGLICDPGNPAAADPVERESSRPDAMVLCYAVTNMAKFFPAGIKRDPELPCTDETYSRILNPISCVSPAAPPAFLWHTADDDTVDVAASVEMFQALHACGVTAEMHLFAHGAHGLGLATENAART